MSRPRTTGKHLPKYVTVIHGAYWYRAPDQKAVRIADEGDDQALWKFMLDKATPVPPPGPTVTMRDILDRYQRDILPSLGQRTQKDYARHLDLLRATFGHMKPDEIEPRHIGAFLERKKGKIQANRQVAVLSSVFSKAVGRWYMAKTNPCANVERNPSKRRRRYVTNDEYNIVYALMPPRMQIAMDLALITGQRQGDLLSLKWEQVDPVERTVTFEQSKTGKKLAVCFSDTLEAVLVRARAMIPHLPRTYVNRTRKGVRYTGEGFRAIWQRGMRKALARGLIKERYTFHDLRAKAVSDSKSIEEAYERAGHTSMAMTRGVYDRGTRKVKPLR